MRRIAAVVIGVLALTSGIAPVSYAQSGGASISATPRIENGYEIFEIQGKGFPVENHVKIVAINQRTHNGIILTTETDVTGAFSGAFLGKDFDGRYFVVPPGDWKVRAKSDYAIAKASFESRNRLREGLYGGEHSSLRVMGNGATITLECADGKITEPVFVDENGNFVAKGTLTGRRGPRELPTRDIRVDGHVENGVVVYTITAINTETHTEEVFGPFTVVYNRQPSFERCT